MTDYHDVRDALCDVKESVGSFGLHHRLLTDSAAFDLAPRLVRAFKAAEKDGMQAAITALKEPK